MAPQTGVTITDALERYQAMSSQFSQSRECQLLVKLAAAISGQNVDEFADAVADYDTVCAARCVAFFRFNVLTWSLCVLRLVT